MSIYKSAEPATGTGVVKGLFNSNHPGKDNPFLTKKDLILVRPYKVYSALMSQSFAGDPTVTVLENTLGVNLVWVRTASGAYEADGLGALTSGKSSAIIQTPSAISTFTNKYPFIAVATVSFGVCYVSVIESVGFTSADDGLGEAFLEMRVYE